MVMCPDDLVTENDLPIGDYGKEKENLPDADGVIDLQHKLNEMEFLYLQQAYQRHGNVRAAAKSLGMDPSTFARRKRKLGEMLLQK
jgi:transcriptional regulator with PAS, ATPase and Fis domain